MGQSQTSQTEMLEHYLNNADIPDIGDASGLQGSAADGNLYISLHTADPGSSDDQTTRVRLY